jgi:glycerol-3-phosphate acyltransferase PlsY
MASITALFAELIPWQQWLLVYLVFGALAMIVLWTKRASRQKTFANELAVIIDREFGQKKSARQRFLEKQLMPALAFLFAWLFWPFILVGRIWVAWRH